MTVRTLAVQLPTRLSGEAAPAFVSDFYEAYVSRDAARLDAMLHDDVSWLATGPADYIDYFGLRSGKAEVIELITRIMPCFLTVTGFEIEQLLVRGDRVATLGRLCAQQRESGRSIRFAVAHFLQFCDGKLISLCALADSFDAAEQITGCAIAVARDAERTIAPQGDLCAM